MRARGALWLVCCALASCDDDETGSVPLAGLDARVVIPPDVGPVDCDASVGAQDLDHDGYSRQNGDCDDCDPGLGPNALDIPQNGIDEDCADGDAHALAPACDGALDPEDTSAESAARALGLCRVSALDLYKDWGLVKARWVRLAGDEALEDARQVWLPARFGTLAPREGARLVALSTGVARDAVDEAFTPLCDVFGSRREGLGFRGGATPPAGFPRDSNQCEGDAGVSEGAPAYNDVGLELSLRTPSNARALAFDSLFLTYEYPDYVCQRFNDSFVVLMDPEPRDADHGNILVDANDDPIGVNSGLLSVCRPAKLERTRRPIACSQGPELLKDTGFDRGESSCAPIARSEDDLGGASTGWLHTEVPVKASSLIKLTIRLWDSGDPVLDSTVLLDGLRFLTVPVEKPSTGPISAR